MLQAFPGWRNGKDMLRLEIKTTQGSRVSGSLLMLVVYYWRECNVCKQCCLSYLLPLLLLTCQVAVICKYFRGWRRRGCPTCCSYVLPHNCWESALPWSTRAICFLVAARTLLLFCRLCWCLVGEPWLEEKKNPAQEIFFVVQSQRWWRCCSVFRMCTHRPSADCLGTRLCRVNSSN